MLRQGLFMVLAFLAALPDGRACSLVPGAATAQMPLTDTGVVAEPLLVTVTSTPALHDDQGQPVSLDPFGAAPFQDAVGGWHETLFLFRPAAPLASGAYTFDNGATLRSLVVDSGASPTPPVVGTNGTLQFFHGTADESGGCGGAVSTCGDMTRMVIDLPDATPGAPFLLTLSSPGAPALVLLVTESFAVTPPELLLWGFEFPELADRESCVTVAAVAEDGTLSPALDLGCIDPGDPTDPRVINGESVSEGGCLSQVPAMELPALLAVLWLVRLSRRRCFAATNLAVARRHQR